MEIKLIYWEDNKRKSLCKTKNSMHTRTNELILEEIQPLRRIRVKAHKKEFLLKQKKSDNSKKFGISQKEFKNPCPSYLPPLKYNNENKQSAHAKVNYPKKKDECLRGFSLSEIIYLRWLVPSMAEVCQAQRNCENSTKSE